MARCWDVEELEHPHRLWPLRLPFIAMFDPSFSILKHNQYLFLTLISIYFSIGTIGKAFAGDFGKYSHW
jgi:hypothetical protein